MMTSSGSGSYRVGGSLSSSNLSPLAPPFKVDKSLPKPNPVNPSVNFSDAPMYGACFDPTPVQFWNTSSSSASGPKCTATESLIINANCSSSTNIYGYRDPQSSTSPASVFYGSTNAVSTYDPFSYDPFSNFMPSNTDDVTKPYYPPYISPPPQKDGFLGLGSGSKPGYDMLSLSGSAQLNGCGNAQVDSQHTMSGDEGHKSKWGYFWSGSNGSEHSKWTDSTHGFVSKDLTSSNISSNESSLFVDRSNKTQPFVDINVRPFVDGSNRNHLFDDVSNVSHLKQGACLTQDLGLHGQVSTVSAKDSCFDIFGGVYSGGTHGIEQQGSESSRMRNSASESISKESPHLREPVSSFCGSQKANGSSPEDKFSQAGFSMFVCASTTSTFPISVTKLPYGGSRSSIESTPSAVQLNSMGIDAVNQSNVAVGYNSSCQLEAQMPLGLNRQSSIRIRRPVPSTAASSLKIGETADVRLDDKAASEKIKILPQLPHPLSLRGLNMETSDAEAVYTIEKHSGGSEGHNPAEDSPCWKGASSNRFSPFGHSESVDSDVLVKTIDRCQSLSSQDLQNNNPLFDTLDSKEFSGKVNEAFSLEKPSVSNHTSNDYDGCDSANPKPRRFDLNTGDNLQFADDCHASMMECNMINNSKVESDLRSFLLAQMNQKGDLSSARNISEAPVSGKSGNGTPVVTESLPGLSSNIDHNNSKLLPGHKSSLKSAGEDPDSRIDVNMLLRTMMNLSEICRCYCFSNQAKVTEKHAVATKQIISNLNASMLLMSGLSIPTPLLSTPENSFQKELPAVQMMSDAEALADSLKLGGTTEDFLDCVSFKDDGFPFAEASMTKAVKQLIFDSVQEEEMDQQKLLYKNLWLEAEASLCVMTAKARYLRMRTVMRTHDGIKDRDNPISSNAPVDLREDVELAIDEKDSLSKGECSNPTKTDQHNHIKVFHNPNSQVATVYLSESETSKSTKIETCVSSTHACRTAASDNSHTNGVDSCLLSRYQILKNRVGCSDSLNYDGKHSSGEHHCPSSVFDLGNGFCTSISTTKANDVETSVFGGYQILKGQDDNCDYLNYDNQLSPGDENYLPDNESSNPNKVFQNCQMSNSLGVTDESEASVMARFRIIQSRMDSANSMFNDSAPGVTSSAVVENGTENVGGSQQKGNIRKTTFGPYPELTEDEDANIGVNEIGFNPILKTNRMSSVIVEGWYDNDCSSSDWEHITSRDV